MRVVSDWILGVRRQKASLDKSQDEGAEEKEEARTTTTPTSSEIITPPSTSEKKATLEKSSISLRKPTVFAQNGAPSTPVDDTVAKRKRARKTDSEVPDADRKPSSSSKPSVCTGFLF